tara:strand:+ start:139 stop:1062 length:924 start_codon:yes stop_codon:yes gene_type:complete
MLLDGQKILITGTYGFLGRFLANRFSKLGAVIYGIGHGKLTSKELDDNGITNYVCDDLKISTLKDICDKPNKIIHCASSSSVPYSVLYPKEDFERTTNSTLAVLEFMRLYAKEAKLVIPSSAAVYGQKGKIPISVNAKINPVSPYGNSKRIAEMLSKFYGKHFKLKISIVRLFSLYGPGLKKQLLWDACQKAILGNHLYSGTGLETRDWIYINDAASLILLALENASISTPIVNGGTGKSVSIKELLIFLYKKLGIDVTPKFSEIVREGDPLYFEADIKESLSLGWKPEIFWEDGVLEYVKWYKSIY